jgi:23S rRNA (guanosine2251-2'-O)-methyltransferase
MDGIPYWEADLTGPITFVMGGESKGVTDTLKKRCDLVVSVPLELGLDSLNVSVTAAILMFERVRQQHEKNSNS